jgi:hypothetical protein
MRFASARASSFSFVLPRSFWKHPGLDLLSLEYFTLGRNRSQTSLHLVKLQIRKTVFRGVSHEFVRTRTSAH